MNELLFALVNDYYKKIGEPFGPIHDLKKEQLNELIEDTFTYHKKEFNCYEPVRAKIRNYITPIYNACGLIEHALRMNTLLNRKELERIGDELKLSLDKLLSL